MEQVAITCLFLDHHHPTPQWPRAHHSTSEAHLFSELDDQRQLVVLDEVQQLLLGDLTLEVVAAFIKLWTEGGL